MHVKIRHRNTKIVIFYFTDSLLVYAKYNYSPQCQWKVHYTHLWLRCIIAHYSLCGIIVKYWPEAHRTWSCELCFDFKAWALYWKTYTHIKIIIIFYIYRPNKKYVCFRFPTTPKFRSLTLIFLLSFLLLYNWFFSEKNVFTFKSIFCYKLH